LNDSNSFVNFSADSCVALHPSADESSLYSVGKISLSEGPPAATTAIFEAVSLTTNDCEAMVLNGFIEIVDSESGEIAFFKKARDGTLFPVLSPAEKTTRKYERQAAMREILGPAHRVCTCHRNPIKGAEEIEVWIKTNANIRPTAHFKGLMVCALPWICAICNPKISEERAKEIQIAISKCQFDGGTVLMPTFTIPHGRLQPLSETLGLMKAARRWLSSTRAYKNLIKELKVIGLIIATEITHGEANGFHPHFHELWFFPTTGIDVQALEQALFELWADACFKFGLGEPNRKHGLVVQDGKQAAQYVAKMGNKDYEWGLAEEMAKASLKNGRAANRSMWQILDCYLDAVSSVIQRHRCEQILLEYARDTKGVRALSWSRGLKKYFGVAEKTEEELAASSNDIGSYFLNGITHADWNIVRKYNLQAIIRNVAPSGREAINSIIKAYRKF
jgi:hypothetical protein